MLFLFAIFIILFSEAFGLKTTDLCLVRSEQIIKKNTLVCIGTHSYQCTREVCAVNKSSCDDFKNLNLYLHSIKSKSKVKKIKQLMSAIKYCSGLPYVFDSSDICVNSYSCFTTQGLNHLAGKANMNFVRKSYCPCSGRFGVKCQTQYCAVSQDACYGLKLFHNENYAFSSCN